MSLLSVECKVLILTEYFLPELLDHIKEAQS
jgi:chorismate-pyruvate lyase